MIVIMLTKELRKILADGAIDVDTIKANIKSIEDKDVYRVIRFDIGCGTLEVPWFSMSGSGSGLCPEDILSPCSVVMESDPLNQDIFRIISATDVVNNVIDPVGQVIVDDPDLEKQQVSTDNDITETDKDPDKKPHKCACGGKCSKGPFEGSNYVPKKHQW